MLYLKSLEPAASDTDMLVIPVCEDTELHDHPLLSSMVARIQKLDEFKGAKGDEVVLYNPPGAKAHRVLFIGLGPAAEVDREIVRAAAGRAVKQALQKKLRNIAVVVPSLDLPEITPEELIESLLEGAGLANHSFVAYKTDKDRRPLKRIDLLVPPETARACAKLSARIWEICQGSLMARDWVNMPANDKTPAALARSIAGRARSAGLQVKTFGQKELQKEKFGAIIAVSAASRNAPAMVELVHAPKGVRKTVVIVGKGVTFDSGGLNLKTSKTLSMMKSDMAGAAAAAAALLAIARLKPKLRVVGIVPLVENMLSGSATRPGDIIRAYSGKTVEIGNTDAEGRLILADAIAYAVARHKPDFLIDVATLTGACVMALGEGMAGLFSNNEPLAAAILQSAEKTHERCWRMPLPEDYKDQLKSELADFNNMPATRWGGAITAALFLKEFIGQTPWAHIDIAGPAYRKNGSDYCGPGATGFGVRLLCDLLGRLE
ncbi:MAG: leucyl aminopeptidase [Desulfobacterales bacterium]